MRRLLPIALLLLLGCVTAGTVWPGLGPVALDYLQQRSESELGFDPESADAPEVWIVNLWDRVGNRARCAAVPQGQDCPLCDGSKLRVQIPRWGQDHLLEARCVLTLRSTGQLDTTLEYDGETAGDPGRP